MKKKTNKRKKRAYRIVKKIDNEEIYKILNKVQVSKKEAKFSVEKNEAETIENVIKDLNLIYKRKNLKRKSSFVVRPNNKIDENVMEDMEDDFFQENLLK